MTASFFRSSKPLTLFAGILIAAVLRSAFFFTDHNDPVFQTTAVFEFVFRLLGFFEVTDFLAAFLLVIIQAFLFNKIVEDQKLLDRVTYLPFVIYAIFISFYPSALSLSPELISLTLLLVVIRRVLNISSAELRLSLMFEAGLILGVAFLFTPQIILFLFLPLAAVAYFHASGWRRYLIPFAGFIVPFYLYAGFGYVFYDEVELFSQRYFMNFELDFPDNIGLVLSVQAAVILGFTGVPVIKRINTGTVRVSKCYSLILMTSAAGLLVAYLSVQTALFNLLFSVPGFALIASNYIFNSKRRVLSTIVFYLITACALFNVWLL